MSILSPLLVGFAFGWLLQKAGLSRYDRIVNVYRLVDLTVVKVLLTALVTGGAALLVLEQLGFSAAAALPVGSLLGAGIGGVLFGIGMAVSGFCPGTVAAGAGEGRLDYLVAGVGGLVAGALAFGFLYPHLAPWLARLSAKSAPTLPRWLGVSPWLVVVVLAEVAGLLFYVLERGAAGARGSARSRR